MFYHERYTWAGRYDKNIIGFVHILYPDRAMEWVCVTRICVEALYHSDLIHLIPVLDDIILGWTYWEQINTLVYKFAAV